VARTGAVVAGLGLLFGGLGFALHGGAVAQLEREALLEVSQEDEGWVWVDGRALRQRDGAVVEPGDGTFQVGRLVAKTEGLPDAWRVLRPELASNGQLATSESRIHQVELQGRLARVLACGILAFWVWLPLADGSKPGLLEVIGVGLGWSLLELVLHGMARSDTVPIPVGAWLPVLALSVLVGARLLQSQGVRQSRTQT